MDTKISTLEIQRFRAIRRLRVEGLGRVNLLTGRNNTGKSSVLEALRILVSEGAPSVIYQILRSREEDLGETIEPRSPSATEGPFPLSSLFHGFPSFSRSIDPIVIISSGGMNPMKLTLHTEWISEETDATGSKRFVPSQRPLFGESELLPALLVETNGVRRILPLDYWRRYPYSGRIPRSEMISEQRPPCVFVSPYGGERTAALGPLWDRIALSDDEREVVDALRLIDADINAVSMVGGESPKQLRTAIVRTAGFPRPVPLRSFGDGLNRLFGIVLSLVNAKGGLLLIDEFENGMHHTVQTHVWRAVFKLATRLDIQVVATSHSWDAIESFQEAASEDPEEGVLIRLSRKDQDVIPTVFREAELAVVTRERIEVR